MKLAILLALLCLSAPAVAEDFPAFPTQFLVSQAPPQFGRSAPLPAAPSAPVEKPSAINGLNYTAVGVLFNGQNNNYSYIRFPNGNTIPAVTNITVVGVGTGTVYGTAHVTVPSGASTQVSYSDIMAGAGVGSTIGGEAVSIYLQNNAAYTGFQHVIWNSVSGFFENLSNCTWLSGANYHFLNQAVVNIDTTNIPAYPSNVTVTNLLGSSVQMALQVYDSVTGAYIGTYNGTAVPNGVYAIPMASIQAAIGWNPGPSQFNANIVVTSPTTTGFYAVAGQLIYNSQLQTYINMSLICPLNY